MRKENFLKSLLIGTALVSISFYAIADETVVIQPEPDTCPAYGNFDMETGKFLSNDELAKPEISARIQKQMDAWLETENKKSGAALRWDQATRQFSDTNIVTESEVRKSFRKKYDRSADFDVKDDKEAFEDIRAKLNADHAASLQLLDKEVAPNLTEKTSRWTGNKYYEVIANPQSLQEKLGQDGYKAFLAEYKAAWGRELQKLYQAKLDKEAQDTKQPIDSATPKAEPKVIAGDNTSATASATPSPTIEPSTSATPKTTLVAAAEVILAEKDKTAATIKDAKAQATFEQNFGTQSELYRSHIEGVITLDHTTLDKVFAPSLNVSDEAANTAATSAAKKHNDERTTLFAQLEDLTQPVEHFTTAKDRIVGDYDTAINDVTTTHEDTQRELDSVSRLVVTTSFNISDKVNQTQAQTDLDLVLGDTLKAVETILQVDLTNAQRAEFTRLFKEGFKEQTAPTFSSAEFRRKLTSDVMSLLNAFKETFHNNVKNRAAYLQGIRDLTSHFNKPDTKPADVKSKIQQFFDKNLPHNATTDAYKQQILEINLDAAKLGETGSSLSSMLSSAMGMVTGNN